MNTEIGKLMREYTKENCDFTDMKWVVKCSLRCVITMPDSQARCFLQAFINDAEKESGK